MEPILEHFKAITAIPRCSLDASAMKEYIKTFALSRRFSVQEDDAGNVLCSKGHPHVCLQAHYDMVCIGECDTIELWQEDSLLKARRSTLGADNGMGMAIMFWAMERNEHLECLFTADEEVGLLGAMQFKMPLQSSYLLNLDAEEAGEIYIGCAGGVDVIASLPLEYESLSKDNWVYEIHAFDFLGGHSGVDIDKKIPSAVKALAYELLNHDVRLISFEGGERRNAIPKSARAIVASNAPLQIDDPRLHVRLLEQHDFTQTLRQSRVIIHALGAFAQGVRAWDRALDIPSTSVNIGIVSQKDDELCCYCSARAMDNENLAILAKETEAFFKGFGFTSRQEGWHGAWKPTISTFANVVQSAMQSFYPHAAFKAIHAGLECGELILRQSKPIEAVSIGPTIRYPHSIREECDVDSVERIALIVQKIISFYKD
jgi:dipeptidase D